MSYNRAGQLTAWLTPQLCTQRGVSLIFLCANGRISQRIALLLLTQQQLGYAWLLTSAFPSKLYFLALRKNLARWVQAPPVLGVLVRAKCAHHQPSFSFGLYPSHSWGCGSLFGGNSIHPSKILLRNRSQPGESPSEVSFQGVQCCVNAGFMHSKGTHSCVSDSSCAWGQKWP